MAQTTAAAVPRAVTGDEVETYRRDGFVKLEGFVSREIAAAMLEAAQAVMGTEPAAVRDSASFAGHKFVYQPDKRGGELQDSGYWQDYHYIARDDKVEPFHSLAFSPEIGRAAQRLMDRDIAVRYNADFAACKMPAGRPGGQATTWHQDFHSQPFDRVGGLLFWIALDEVTPEMGSMQFLRGSHREGPLGRTRVQGKGVNEYYPELYDRYELLDSLHLHPGDATAHHQLVCHGAPENRTQRPRWSFMAAYFPADVLYLPIPSHNFNDIGLEINKPLDHPRFPVVYE